MTRLALFAKKAKELSQLRLLKSDAPWSFSLTLQSAGPDKFEVGGPDEESLRSFLLTFRLFVLKSDPVYIKRVFNDAIRHLPPCDTRDALLELRTAWSERLKRGPLAIFFGKDLLSPEYMLDLWINGHYFHTDAQKSEELHRRFGQSVALIRLGFLMAVADLASIVIQTGALLDHAMATDLIDQKTDPAPSKRSKI